MIIKFPYLIIFVIFILNFFDFALKTFETIFLFVKIYCMIILHLLFLNFIILFIFT